MAWVRIEDGFPEHPKILGLSDAAFRLHILALCYAARMLSDGTVPHVWLTGGKGRHVPKAVDQLVSAGVWKSREDGGFDIHDYLKYQPSRAQITQKRDDAKVRMSFARSSKDVRANTARSSENVRSTPSHPIPSHPNPETTQTPSPRVVGGVIRNALDYEKRREFCAFVGARLEVPHKLHCDLRKQLGGTEPDAKLQAWYAHVDEELERTGEPIVPTIWKWLEARFQVWALDQVATHELEKFRPRGA